mgnify:CR=1 FL=1
MDEKNLSKLVALQASMLVNLHNHAEQLENDSDFWHTRYEQLANENVRLKEQLIAQEGETDVADKL